MNNKQSKKIALFLSTSGHSGVDKSMELLIPELLNRGFQVDLLKVRKHGPYIKHKDLNIIDLGTKHTMSALPALVRYLKAYLPDAVLADKDRCNRTILLAKKLAKSKVKVVVSSGTIMSENLKNRSSIERFFHQFSMNNLYPNAHNIITPSIDAADDLAEISTLPRQQISVVPLPIIHQRIYQQAKENFEHPWVLSKSEPIIISVGELTERKDQSNQLRAFAKVRQNIACKFFIVGKGKNLERLKSEAKQLGIENHVDFLGFQENPHKILSKCDLFVHTATFEGFGMVLIEALALGLPAVSTSCLGGPREILQKGKLGLLSDVGDSDQLAKNMKSTLTNPISSREERVKSIKPYTVGESTNSYIQAMGLL